MIDPVQLPLLMKAVEFLFDEGRRVFEKRRERMQAGTTTPTLSEPDLPQAVAPPPDSERDMALKQDLLASKIDELLWKNHEEEIQHLVRLMEIHSRNHHLASEQYAKWGGALVPPIIVHNLTEAENAMLETTRRLETVLSKVYDRDIPPTP